MKPLTRYKVLRFHPKDLEFKMSRGWRVKENGGGYNVRGHLTWEARENKGIV